jgi:HEAT repeat protein
MRAHAAYVLGQVGDPSVVEPLCALLRDKNGEVNAAAALLSIGELGMEALVQIGEPAVKALRWCLETGGYCDPERAVRTLARIGAPALKPMYELLHQDTRYWVCDRAARVLGNIRDRRAVEPLCQALGDRNDFVRKLAAEVLGNIRDRRAVEPLCQALGDENAGVRAQAAGALGNIGDGRAVEPLCRALGDRDGGVRRWAAEALGHIGSREALPALKVRLRGRERERDESVIAAIHAAIEKIEKATPEMAGLPRAAEAEAPTPAGRPRAAEDAPTPEGKPREG